ncbi:MAG: hypothetical protein ABSF28_17510 [Terracidiphilus sp.]|jgi:hypothetical protein
MRISTILLPLLLFPGLARSSAQMSQALVSLPSGEISAGVYHNETLGITFRAPEGWTLSTDVSNASPLDSSSGGLANRCARILLRQDAPKSAGSFLSSGIFFVIDAKCLALGRFPKSVKDKDEITRFSQSLIDNFKNSDFILPGGVDVDTSPPEAKHHGVIVTVRGSGFVAGSLGEATETHLNTSFSVTEHNGLLLGWASITDDAASERLKQEGKIEFKAE